LAVILTDPKGEPEIRTIEKEQMMANSASRYFSIRSPQAGTYVLVVKTVEPEKVVWQGKIEFLPTELVIEDVEIAASSGMLGGVNVIVSVRKSGNLPAVITDLASVNNYLMIDGEEYFAIGSPRPVIMGERETIRLPQIVPHWVKPDWRERFKVGNKCTIKGRLLYGEGKQADFEKAVKVKAAG
jgi:hypothetical protein